MSTAKKPRVDIAYEGSEKVANPLTLYDKIFRDHLVHQSEDGAALLYIDRHLVHEVTSPQAFEGLRNASRTVRRPDCTLVTVDHNVPTSSRKGFNMANMKENNFIKEIDSQLQVTTLEDNVKGFGLTYFGMNDSRQGIVHVIGPEQGFTLPGTTLVCGDSHTATHGAFGALAFGIGTSEVEHVLATQTLVQQKSKNLCIRVNGKLPESTSSKDMMLHIIGVIGTGGGTGCVIEFCGEAIEALSIEARMSMCNMAIEAGARAGLIAPDETTFEYVMGRPMAPTGTVWNKAVEYWKTLKTDPGAKFDKEFIIDAEDIIPTVTWGTSPQDVVPITATVPDPTKEPNPQRRAAMERSLEYMGLTPNTPMTDIIIDKIFIGSCTNSRIEDLRAAAAVVSGRKIASNIKHAMVVPGSGLVRDQAEAEGLDKIFTEAGFDWREPGCSMCLGMNPDRLAPGERCASTSNRNFEGRQGKGGRTHLVSPAMAAAAAIAGKLADVSQYTKGISVTKQSTDGKSFLPKGPVMAPAFADGTIKEASTTTASGSQGMPPFTVLSGTCASLDKQNVDTDQIIPAKFLKTIKRSGLGVSAFYEMRYNADGTPNQDFVLNKEPYKNAPILIAGDNFGCGSSREHAPWAMLDMGIRCVISTSLADIFKMNCFKNGMLPIELPRNQVELLMAEANAQKTITVNLETKTIMFDSGASIPFSVDSFRRHCLLNGLDEIALTIQKADSITKFEKGRSVSFPWLDGAGYKPIEL